MTIINVNEARRRIAAGDSARRIAADLGVAPSTVTRALAQDARRTTDAQPPAIGPPGAVSGPAPPPGPHPRPRVRIAPLAPAPPESERSARLWCCNRCGQVGYDPNRGARAWHTPESCDERVEHLDRVLDDRPRERPPWEMSW